MERITSIALNDDFIRGLADILQQDFIRRNIPLERIAVVFGGKRPALFLKRELSRRLNGAYFPPVCFSMEEFVRETVWRQAPAKMAGGMDAAFRIYELARADYPGLLAGRDSFAMFLPWAEEIAAFIEQLDLEEVSDERLRAVQENAEIGFDTLKEVNLLLSDIIKLRREFHGALNKAGALTRGMLYIRAAECAQEVNFDDLEAVIFCGFFYLHKTEQKLIKELLARGKARLVFQGDEDDWDVLKGLSAVFSSPIKAAAPARKRETVIKFYRGFDTHSQIGILRERLEEIDNPDELLILPANPAALAPLLSEISSLGREFNVSIGYPLKRSAVAALFQDIFAAQLSRKGSLYYSRDYLNVLSRPLLKNMEIPGAAIARVAVHKAEEVLTGAIANELAGELFINPNEISGLRVLLEETQKTLKQMDIPAGLDDIAGTLQELNRMAFGVWEKLDNFYDFSAAAEKLIAVLLERSPLEKYAPNLQAAEKILELAEELRGAAFCREKFAPEEMFRIFTRRLERETVSFTGSPLKGMQVLGPLETRSLTFKNVIIMDVNESLLPKLRIYEPFIPRDVMVALGIERLEKEEEIQRYQFTRLISAAEKAHLIYREDRETIRSRFLEDLIWQEEQKQGKAGVVNIPLYSFSIKASPKKAAAKKTAEMVESLKNRVFSASSVNMYVACPLAFYFRYCLGLEEKEDLPEEPEAADVGAFVHKLLEKTYTVFLNRKPVIDAAFERVFFAEFETLFQQEFGRKMKADAFILEDILRYRMKKFLESERQRNDIDMLVMLEKRIPWEIKAASGVFNFIAGVDRVDRLSGGAFLVIDYKTGSAQTPKARLDNLEWTRAGIKKAVKSFQLPIYIRACREYLKTREVNAAIYFLRAGEMQEYLRKSTAEEKEEHLDVCLKALEFILEEIVNPDAVFAADEDTGRKCAYCPYVSLCR